MLCYERGERERTGRHEHYLLIGLKQHWKNVLSKQKDEDTGKRVRFGKLLNLEMKSGHLL